MKVVKFGGSFLASGTQVEKVYNIVLSDPNRKIIVVSTPGKRHSDDIKVTDLLISFGEKTLNGTKAEDEFNTIINRYSSIADDKGFRTRLLMK